MHILSTYLSVVLQLTVVIVYLYRLAYFKRKSTDKHAHEKIEKKYLFYFLNLVFLGMKLCMVTCMTTSLETHSQSHLFYLTEV